MGAFMKKLKVGIVGCGNIFPMHALPVTRMEMSELAAICDIKEDRASKWSMKLGCRYYVDYVDMIDKEDLDVVHICTPHYMHAPIAIHASKAGKHVLTEKPMSIALDDARAMIEAARANDITLGVIFQNRYNAGSRLIKESLESGSLGRILSGKLSVTWDRSDEYYTRSDWKGTWDKEGGGVIIDQAIHTMDLMRWFIDSDLEYVDASISNRAHKTIEVEDSAEGVLKFKNGVLAAFFAINYYTYDAPVEMELHCEKGIAKMMASRASVRYDDGHELIADTDPNEYFEYGDGVKDYWGISHVKQIRNFYESLVKGVKPEISCDDAIKTQQLICAIYESGKSRKRIVF